MDVHCSTCNEPWDIDHLRHEEIFETDLSYEEAKVWLELPQAERLNDRYRGKFRLLGWEFGQSVITVIRCPACPKGSEANAESVEIKTALEELLGGDEDGLAAMLEDYGL